MKQTSRGGGNSSTSTAVTQPEHEAHTATPSTCGTSMGTTVRPAVVYECVLNKVNKDVEVLLLNYMAPWT